MQHLKPEEENYDYRWAIGYRKRDDWWGVVALFPLTHERHIDEVMYEMILAKDAIQQLKGRLLSA